MPTDDLPELGQAERRAMEHRHVFAVDGASAIPDMARDVLQREDFAVTTTNDVPGSIAQIAAPHPDLLIVDLEAGKRGASDLLERFVSRAATQRVPVAVISSDPALLARPQADRMRWSGDRPLARPCSPTEVRRAVHGLIGEAETPPDAIGRPLRPIGAGPEQRSPTLGAGDLAAGRDAVAAGPSSRPGAAAMVYAGWSAAPRIGPSLRPPTRRHGIPPWPPLGSDSALPDPLGPGVAPPKGATMAAGSPLPQVLAVGDSPQPSGLHRGLLGRDGYRDSTAADAEPAEIGRQRPDAIVLDGRWEGIEAGPSLLGRLEADPVPAEILPLVLSFAGRGHRRLAADLATRDIAVAPKPVAPADLRPGVRVALPPDAGRAAPGPTPTPRTVPPPRQPAGFFAGVSRGAAVAEEAFRVRVEAILAGGGIGTEPWSPPDAGDVSEDHEDAADPPRGGALGSGRRRRRLPAGRKECASMSRIATADQAHPIDRRPPAGWGASATNPDPPKLPQPDAQPAQKVPKPPKPRKKEKRRPGRKG